ncbi:transglutaminase family protein [Microbacterium sp. 18062]|uniref:transglutaminase-like domain-containing protein n=1 Tax=Microbacterium sp. 18062 TaxID=2681410 RepID=UPI0013576A19|nr:transglutaminase-like domain-containing protein [Microbacterium sp. 18062]
MNRDVSAHIALTVTEPADLVFSVAVAAGHDADETLRVSVDGVEAPVDEVRDAHGTRLHRVRAQTGSLLLDYNAAIRGRAVAERADAADPIRYLRPSRYAESDVLAPTAAAEFGGIEHAADLLAAVSSWVGTHLMYVPGSSLPTDGAERTLLARQGVCRDYAHLCVALLRASGIPARLAAVYAPGLDPMDFHAVAEAWVDDAWCVVDATTLAPRDTLVRIATGRDAADTAFLTVQSGRADLDTVEVTAVADELPTDDITRLVPIG